MIEIEKSIPFPDFPKKKRTKYPFDKMEVGDSFFYPVDSNLSTGELQMKLINASCSFRRRVKNPNLKFTSKQLENGVRVWRLK